MKARTRDIRQRRRHDHLDVSVGDRVAEPAHRLGVHVVGADDDERVDVRGVQSLVGAADIAEHLQLRDPLGGRRR